MPKYYYGTLGNDNKFGHNPSFSPPVLTIPSSVSSILFPPPEPFPLPPLPLPPFPPKPEPEPFPPKPNPCPSSLSCPFPFTLQSPFQPQPPIIPLQPPLNEGIGIMFGNRGDGKLQGLLGDDRLYGGDDNDTLYGNRESVTTSRFSFGPSRSDNDKLTGGKGNDVLVGYGGLKNEKDILHGDQSSSQPGRIDIGDGADVFVLGDSSRAYYDGDDTNGYAVIKDFYYAEGDKIRVHGNRSDYSLGFANRSGSSSTDTLIEYQDDLIAVVEDTTNIIISADFVFV